LSFTRSLAAVYLQPINLLKTYMMMKKAILLVLTVSFFAQGCKKDEETAPEQEVTQTPTVNSNVKLAANTTFGSILTDSQGMSLYFFSKDTKGASLCEGGCISLWPIFYEENITAAAGLVQADFATITRADGAKQTTYKGWPLYYFSNDAAAGETNGDMVNDVWYIAKPDYSLMYVVSQLTGHDNMDYLNDYTLGTGNTFYITDIEGNTLYTFKNDSSANNKFTAPDFSNNGVWPIAEITLDKIPSILNASDFSTINVFGRTQLTYKGWPLYYFGQDADRGDNKGISFPAAGVWPIANTSTLDAPTN